MLFAHILRKVRNFFENMQYSDTNIRVQNLELVGLKAKSAQDDCSIERLRTSNEDKEREIERMTHQMNQMLMSNTTINYFNAPVVSNGGTLAGNIIN